MKQLNFDHREPARTIHTRVTEQLKNARKMLGSIVSTQGPKPSSPKNQHAKSKWKWNLNP